MSCCKKSCCKKASPNLPASSLRAKDVLNTARLVVERLLSVAHFNNTILPADISPLKLANLINDLRAALRPDAAAEPPTNYVLKFGPNKAYELHLPATNSEPPAFAPDPQQKFDFESLEGD